MKAIINLLLLNRRVSNLIFVYKTAGAVCCLYFIPNNAAICDSIKWNFQITLVVLDVVFFAYFQAFVLSLCDTEKNRAFFNIFKHNLKRLMNSDYMYVCLSFLALTCINIFRMLCNIIDAYCSMPGIENEELALKFLTNEKFENWIATWKYYRTKINVLYLGIIEQK